MAESISCIRLQIIVSRFPQQQIQKTGFQFTDFSDLNANEKQKRGYHKQINQANSLSCHSLFGFGFLTRT